MSDFVPKVGEGCTYCVGSDRYPYTIIKVISNKAFLMSEDTVSDGKYFPSLDGDTKRVSLRKDGRWRTSGKHPMFVRVGERDRYLDPDF